MKSTKKKSTPQTSTTQRTVKSPKKHGLSTHTSVQAGRSPTGWLSAGSW